ncbi:MAG: gliding motility-associated C-terminal domain-containing protein [Flavobacteriales bacterium]|nr:gliding motility-associated C-terminal domain-containing protein [Flavobacteriales bacterium]
MKSFLRIILVPLIILFSNIEIYATHAMGGDIWYECNGGNSYTIYFAFYRDCNGVAAPNTISISRSSSCTGASNITLNRVPGTGQDITPTCPGQQTNCSGGNFPGVQKYVYSATVTLTPCDDWVFSTSICCRNNAITNINNPGGQNMYLEATLDNLNFPCNSSPVFSSDPVPYVCVGETFCFNHGAIDVEGDSISFSLIVPYDQGPTDPVSYNAGFSPNQPISSSPLMTFNPNTGDICMTPSTLEVSVTAVVIEQWRNGQLVGTNMRDIQIVVINCNNQLPTVDGIDATNSFSTNACAGSPIVFTTTGADNDAGNLLTMSWNAGIPGATFNIANNGTTSPVGTFSWTPTLAQVSGAPYCFTVTIKDDQCPLNGFQIYSFCITVDAGLVVANGTGTDLSCFGVCDGSAVVNATGGTTPFTYSIDGTNYSNSNTFNGLCSGIYDLFAMDSNGCIGTDQVSLIEPSDLVLTTSSIPVSCNAGSDGLAGVTVSGGIPPYSYLWSNGQVTAGITGLSAGNYSVTVTDANGCTEIANVTISQPTPITFGFNNTNPGCAGNDGVISVIVSGGTPAYSYDWSNNPSLSGSIATNLTVGNYLIQIEDQNGCTVDATTSLVLTGSANAGFTYNGNQCLNNNSYVFSNQGSTGGTVTYEWDFGDGVGTSTLENPTYVYTTPGTFTVEQTVTDGLCTDVSTLTIVVYDVPILSTVTSDVSCNGGNDGEINLSVSGGQPNYGYFWNNNAITRDLSSLTVGTYSVIVSDNNGCLGYDTVLINEPTLLQSVVVENPSTCQNLCNGSGSLSITGGTSPYFYDWNDPLAQSSSSASNLCAGLYDVEVTDNNGCLLIVPVSIINTDTINVTTSILPSSCGQPDGELTANPTGGTGPYNYIWASLGQTTQTAINVPSGNYVVQVIDANGCIGYDTTLMSDIPAPTAIISNITNVLCNGQSTGSAEVNAVGGTGVYSYFWSNGDTDSLANNLVAGQYSVTVIDDAGCIAQATVTITQPTAMNGITGSVNANCGLVDGSASVIVSGGVIGSGYTYQWSDGTNIVGTTPSVIVAAGNYTVNVSDNNGCILTRPITVNDNPAGTVNTLSIDESCFGSCNGSGIATISGGTAPFQYQWDDPNATFGPNIVGLCEGTYHVSVTDGKGCIVNDSIVVGVPPKLLVNIISEIDVTCFGDSDGSIEIIATGGVQPYQYLWDTGAGSQTGTLVSNLMTGNYTVVVTDANGCNESVTGFIDEPDDIVLSSFTQNAHCNLPDGNASVSIISGGVGPFNYSWTNSSSTNALAPSLIPGSYTVTVTDNDGCTADITMSVGNTPAGTATVTNQVDPTCFGSCNGVAAVSMSGTGVGPFTYSWNNSTAQTTVFATGLCGGAVYTVTVTDVNGCVSTANVSLNDPPALQLSLTSSDAICYDECTGAISSNVTGGTPPYNYQWNDPSQQVTSAAVNLCALTPYNLTVTDDHNCSISQIASVGQPTPIEVDSTVVNSFCGQSIGTACINITGGIPGYDINWLHDGSTTTCLSNLSAGTYLVEITDANDCPAQSSVTVTDVSGPLANVGNITHVSCAGGTNGQATAFVTGGTAPFSYLWDSNTGSQTTPTASNLSAGSYTFTIVDSAGCVASSVVSIIEPQPLVVTFNASNPICYGTSDGVLNTTVFGGTLPFTYSWSHNAALTSSSATGLPAGFYSVLVTDANGCTANAVASLVNPAPLSASISGTDLGCNGICTGSATVIPSNGTTPYQYLWNDDNIQTTQTASGLCADTYQVIVTDAHGCLDTSFVTIEEPDSLLGSISLAGNVSCHGLCDGFAEVAGTGGTLPYSYSWSNGATSQLISNLCPGTYGAIISDANGCVASVIQMVSQPLPLTGTIIKNNATCYGTCNGSANYVVSGGTTPYAYQWNDPSFQTTAVANNLCAGTYNISVSDAHGCILITNTTIAQPNVMQLTTNTTNSNCGQSNGMACVSVTGGVAPYTYQWDDGNSQTTACALGVPSGSYSVFVTDDNNCVYNTQVNITDLSGPSITLDNIMDVTCNGLSNGEIQMSFTGGTAPYQSVSWTNAQGNVVGSANNPILSSVSAGCYTFEVEDNVGCLASLTACIAQPNTLQTAFINVDNVQCFNSCDGEATVVYSGGTAPYSILWNDGTTTATNSNLCVGASNATVTDIKGCTSNSIVNITQPSPLTTVQSSISATLCAGSCDGSIQLQSLGGTAPYIYAWSPGGFSSNLASGLCAGNYVVQTTDAHGCQIVTNYTVTSPLPLAGTIASVTTTCGLCNGTATLSGSGGTAPYTYSWQDAQSSQTAIGVCSGVFSGYIIDDNGCQLNLSTNVPNIAGPTIDNMNATDLTCNGDNSGALDVTISAGTSPLAYSWNLTTQTTSSINSLSAGNYCVQVTDGNGCIAYDCEEVTQPNALIGVADQNATICYGDSAQIWASAIGGTAPYSFQWLAPNSGLTGSGPLYVDPLLTSDYCFTVADNNGCTGLNQACVTITVAPPLQINTPDSLGVCLGDEISITSTASGGNGGVYYYDWYYPDLQSGVISTNQDLTNYEGGLGYYYVNLSDGCSLETLDSTLVYQVPVTSISINSPDTVVCYPDAVTIEVTSDYGSVYNWDLNSDGVVDFTTTDSIINVNYNAPGFYNVTVYVESDFGCLDTIQNVINYTVLTPPIAAFEASPIIVSIVSPEVNVLDQSTNAVSWEWDFNGDGTADRFVQNPSYNYQALGDYAITLTVADTNGCIDTASINISVIEEYSLYVPNTFTPDDDGKNDVFYVYASGYDEYRIELWIFDRWGQLIYFNKGVNGWDGTYNGGLCQQDTYVWMVKVPDKNGLVKTFRGHVNLLR